MRITGISDKSVAEKYLETAWKAIEYIHTHYRDKVYLGIGLVYNKDLVSLEEIAKAGDKIASIDPQIQVVVLDYFPTFRRKWLKRPTTSEMLKVKHVLEDRGLRTVIVQTEHGLIGPGDVRLGYFL
jgi:pyruvate formate lyase activating enzyme